MTAMGWLPVSLPGRIWERAASGAAVNAGVGMAQRGSMSAYLTEQGYGEGDELDLASQYQWLDGRAVAIDAIFGAAFGAGFGHRAEGAPPPPPVPQVLRDAAIIEADSIHRETAFGIPENEASRRYQRDTLEHMEAQAGRDEDLSPAPPPDDVGFVPLPEGDPVFEQALAETLRENGYGDAEARLDQLKWEARARGIEPEEGALYSMGSQLRGVDPWRGSERFEDDRLTARESKIVEMARNNYSNNEIAEEMDATNANVGVTLNTAKRKIPGLEIRPGRNGSPPGLNARTYERTATIEQIISLYKKLARQGYRNGPGRPGPGRRTLNTVLAERLRGMGYESMTPDSVKQRLFHYRRDLEAGRIEGEPLYSMGDGDSFSAVDELQARASEEFGADWTALSRAGRVEIVPSIEALAARLREQGREDAAARLERDQPAAVHYASEGKAYFVAEHIGVEEMRGIVLHEIGVHHGMETMLGSRGWKDVLRQVERMAKDNHPAFAPLRRQADEIIAAGLMRKENAHEEMLASLIEAKADLPIVSSLLSRLRQWMIKEFGTTFGMRLTVDDLRALAVTSLRRVAEQARREAVDVTEIAPIAPDAGSVQGGNAPQFRDGQYDVYSDDALSLRMALRDHEIPLPGQEDAPPLRPRGQQFGVDLQSRTIPLRELPNRTQGVDADVVRDYTRRAQAGERPPPILVRRVSGGHQVFDGQHRVNAARAAGQADIEAIDATPLFDGTYETGPTTARDGGAGARIGQLPSGAGGPRIPSQMASDATGRSPNTGSAAPGTEARAQRASAQGFDTSAVWYHGTNQPVAQFESQHFGSSTGSQTSRLGVWITDDPGVAETYADLAARKLVPDHVTHDARVGDLQRRLENAERRQNWNEVDRLTQEMEQLEFGAIQAEPSGQNVMPLVVRMRNPARYDAKGQGVSELGDFDAIVREAQARGHDGIIFDNLADTPNGIERPARHAIVFDTDNVRSAFDNFSDDPSASALGNGPNRPLPDGGPADERYSMGSDGQNRPNLLGAKRDPIDNPEYQRRLFELQRGAEGERQAGAGKAEGERSEGMGRVARDDAGGRSAGSDARSGEWTPGALRELLEVSSIRLTSKKTQNVSGFGEYRAEIDTPFASDADAVLQAGTGVDGGPTRIDFDLIDGSNPKDTRLPGVHVRFSRVNDGARGAKVGVWLYRQLIEWADRRGLPVYSDGLTVSADAQRVYAALERRGYSVERVGRVQHDTDGALISLTGDPIFRASIRDVIDEPLTGAPLPREDYQIDGPTLRDRQKLIDEQLAREEEYNNLSPTKQILQDKPDEKFTFGQRGRDRITAAKLHEDALVEAEGAREARKAMEAAARCAARHGVAQAARGASYITMGWTPQAAASAGLGQVTGMALAIPFGITAAPVVARNANPVRYHTRRAENAMNEARLLADAALGSNDERFPLVETAPPSETFAPADLSAPEESAGYVKPGQAIPETDAAQAKAERGPASDAEALIDLFAPIIEAEQDEQ